MPWSLERVKGHRAGLRIGYADRSWSFLVTREQGLMSRLRWNSLRLGKAQIADNRHHVILTVEFTVTSILRR